MGGGIVAVGGWVVRWWLSVAGCQLPLGGWWAGGFLYFGGGLDTTIDADTCWRRSGWVDAGSSCPSGTEVLLWKVLP